MGYKSILAVLAEQDDVAPVLNAALPFVQAAGAHLDVLCMGIDRTQTGYYMSGANAILSEHTLDVARNEALAIEQAARDLLAGSTIKWAVDPVVCQSASTAGTVADHARFADLVLIAKPYGEGRAYDAPVIVEAAMFQGQAPVVVLPGDTQLSGAPKKIVVAWNQSQEAMSAIRRAMPLLVAAEEVNLLIIDPPQHGPTRADPGVEISKLLTRHGAKVEVSIVAKTLPQVSAVIQRHVQDQDADLLVMGAYGHSRFREAILGGATRNLLEQASTPVLMAH